MSCWLTLDGWCSAQCPQTSGLIATETPAGLRCLPPWPNLQPGKIQGVRCQLRGGSMASHGSHEECPISHRSWSDSQAVITIAVECQREAGRLGRVCGQTIGWRLRQEVQRKMGDSWLLSRKAVFCGELSASPKGCTTNGTSLPCVSAEERLLRALLQQCRAESSADAGAATGTYTRQTAAGAAISIESTEPRVPPTPLSIVPRLTPGPQPGTSTSPTIQTPTPPRRHAVCLTGLERSLTEIGANVRQGLLSLLSSLSYPGAVPGHRKAAHPTASRTPGSQAHGHKGPAQHAHQAAQAASRDSRFGVFGVRPVGESWAVARALLPMVRVEAQLQCQLPEGCRPGHCGPELLSWISCDEGGPGRRNCRRNFLQELCDLSHCDAMITAHEHSLQLFARRTSTRPQTHQAGAPHSDGKLDLGIFDLGIFDNVIRLRPDAYWEARIPHQLTPSLTSLRSYTL